MSEESPREESAGSGADYRQVSFVVLAALALVVAAFFAPGVADDRSATEIETNGPDSGADGGSSGDGGDGGGDSIPSFDWFEFFDWFDIDGGDGDGSGEPVDEGGDASECVVALDGDPIPGSDVTATVYYRGAPLADAPVWFDDRSIGRTDELGRVSGEVPYVESFEVRIGVDDGVDCTASEPTAWETSGAMVTGAGMETSGLIETGTGMEPSATGGGAAATGAAIGVAALPSQSIAGATGGGAPAQRSAAATGIGTATNVDDSNGTVEYEVDGSVAVTVTGEPYPGERVTVDAAIDGVPMREATVSVDGDPVAETDETGTTAIAVPDDGTDRFDVEVSRGDFAGGATVDVLLLEARLVPDGLAPVPGSDGRVVAEIAGERVENATVAVAGEDRGRTDGDGLFAIDLPRDPTTTVTVGTDRQTATVTLVGQYAPFALVCSLVVAGAAAVTSRTYGRRGPIAVLGATAGLCVVLVVEAFYGPIGGLVALGAVVGVGAAAVLVGDGGPEPRTPVVGEAAGGFLEWIVDRTLAAVSLLERVVDRLHRLAAAVRVRLSSVPRSVHGLGLALLDRLRSLPARTIGLGRRGLARLREVPTRHVAAIVGAVALLGAGYVVRGSPGVAVAAAVLTAVAVLIRRSSPEAEAETDADDDDATAAEPAANGAGDAEDGSDRPSLREVWRSFAREVAPGRWRTRTPGEIERAALDAGYPREPVRELTRLFREVEYGDRSPSPRVRSRADEAYRELERAKAETEKGTSDRDRAGSQSAPPDSTIGSTAPDSTAGPTAPNPEASPPRESGGSSDSAGDERGDRS